MFRVGFGVVFLGRAGFEVSLRLTLGLALGFFKSLSWVCLVLSLSLIYDLIMRSKPVFSSSKIAIGAYSIVGVILGQGSLHDMACTCKRLT